VSDMMFHCTLARAKRGLDDKPDGLETKQGWIEERGAHLGNIVETKDDGLFWTVTEVHTPGRTKEAVLKDQIFARNCKALEI
jgi:hypothetical protein